MERRVNNAGFTLIELMVCIVIVGVLATTASFAYIKYIRKAQNTEVINALNKIAVGAKAYYQADHYDSNGTLLPKAFPDLGIRRPSGLDCCAQPGGKCAVEENWSGAWELLSFKMMVPTYYQYTFYGGTQVGNDAKFIAYATGNLNCDSVLEYWYVLGEVIEGEVSVKGPMFTDSPAVITAAYNSVNQ